MKACCDADPNGVSLATQSGRSSRRIRFAWLLVLAVLAAAVLVFGIGRKQAGHRKEVVNAMEQFGLALLEFDQQFGGFPSDAVAEEVADATGSGLPLTGGDVLNQLSAFGVHDTMGLIDEIGREDGGWTYVPGWNQCSNPLCPILISPPIYGERMVLRVDNSIGLFSGEESYDLPDYLYDPIVFPREK